MVEVQKPMVFAISNMLARPSAGIGVVEVQKPMVFCDFQHARATLCGDRRGRGAKTHGFLRFPTCPREGIGVIEVQKPMFFCDFCGACATLCGDRRDRGAKTRGFLRFLRRSLCCSNWSSGVVSWFARLLPEPPVAGSIPPWSAGGRRKMQLAFCSRLCRATCAEQVAQSNLRRPTCTDQCAQSALPRATCAEQLAQSNLHRATCTEQLAQSNLRGAQFAQSNLQGATCRGQLAGATCAEQLAQSNLHSATCVEQLAQTNLHRPVCAEHLAWRCPALASQMLRGGKKNASCSVGPTSLTKLCFRANRGLVCLIRAASCDHAGQRKETEENKKVPQHITSQNQISAGRRKSNKSNKA